MLSSLVAMIHDKFYVPQRSRSVFSVVMGVNGKEIKECSERGLTKQATAKKRSKYRGFHTLGILLGYVEVALEQVRVSIKCLGQGDIGRVRKKDEEKRGIE